MTVIEKEWRKLNFYWNVPCETKGMRWNGFEVDYEPHFDSYAKIGLYHCQFDAADSNYGNFVLGLHWGRYLLEFSFKNGIKFHNDYMNVDESKDIPNISPGEYE